LGQQAPQGRAAAALADQQVVPDAGIGLEGRVDRSALDDWH
jgi:hypothetical protein